MSAIKTSPSKQVGQTVSLSQLQHKKQKESTSASSSSAEGSSASYAVSTSSSATPQSAWFQAGQSNLTSSHSATSPSSSIEQLPTLQDLCLKVEEHIKDFDYEEENDEYSDKIASWVESFRKLLNLNEDTDEEVLGKSDIIYITNLDVFLRMTGFKENLSPLHEDMEKKKIKIIPLVNKNLLKKFEEKYFEDLKSKKMLPPEIFRSMKTWQKKAWAEDDSLKVRFHKVKKEVKSSISSSSSREKEVSYCSVALSQEIQDEIEKLASEAEADTPSSSQASLTSSPSKEYYKDKLQYRLHEGVGFRRFVLESAQGRWTLQKHTDVDHVQPFANIRSRIKNCLNYLNKDEFLKNLAIKYNPDYFILEEDNTIMGTQYLYMSIYNYLDNLWLMDQNINSSEKSEVDPIIWLQDNNIFGDKFSFFISNNQEKELNNLVDKSNIIYTLKRSPLVKEIYQGQTLGKAAKDWLKINPHILLAVLQAETIHLRTEELLYFVKDLLNDSDLEPEEKEGLIKEVNGVIEAYSLAALAKNTLRDNLLELLQNHKGLFNPQASPLRKSPEPILGHKRNLEEIDNITEERDEEREKRIKIEQDFQVEHEVRIKAEEARSKAEEEKMKEHEARTKAEEEKMKAEQARITAEAEIERLKSLLESRK